MYAAATKSYGLERTDQVFGYICWTCYVVTAKAACTVHRLCLNCKRIVWSSDSEHLARKAPFSDSSSLCIFNEFAYNVTHARRMYPEHTQCPFEQLVFYCFFIVVLEHFDTFESVLLNFNVPSYQVDMNMPVLRRCPPPYGLHIIEQGLLQYASLVQVRNFRF